MNEKIKQFALKAGLDMSQEQAIENFAKLIIVECGVEATHYDGDYYVADRINESFGLKWDENNLVFAK